MTLRDDILSFIEAGTCEAERFEQLALRLLHQQAEKIPAFSAWCSHRGLSTSALSTATAFPPLPARAFKMTELLAKGSGPVRETFRSSGTSGQRPSESHYTEADLEVMRCSVIRNASQMLFPDAARTRILVLAPAPTMARQLIMSWGMAVLIDVFGEPGSCFLVDSDGLSPKRVYDALVESIMDQVPVTLIGASFGFVHLLDWLATQGHELELLPGSRTMDAGGYKGRSREVTREWLDQEIERRLSVKPPYAVNLLGMTELSSQFYDDVLREGSVEGRSKVNAPWTMTRVLDPLTLKPCAPGEPGMLCHLDLANIERPAYLLTEDMGVAVEGGWQVLGRAPGLEARGCSLSIEELCR